MDTQKTKLQVTKIPRLNSLVITQEGHDFFVSTKNGIIISVSQLANLILILIRLGFLNPKVLEGILEDVHTSEKYNSERKINDR